VASDQAGADGETLEEKDIEWQVWVARVIGELLAMAPRLAAPPQREKMSSALSVCVARAAKDGTRGLARELGVSKAAIYGWRRGRQRPILELLLRLCAHTATSPLDLLAAVSGTVPPYEGRLPVRDTSARRPHVRRRPFDADAVQRALEDVLAGDEHPPPAMRQIAERIGYAHASLHRRFPDLCRAISARYLAYRTARGLQRQQRLCREIRQVAASIHAQGIYPSAYRIEQQLSVPGFIRHPDGMAAWRSALRELGWAN
jgi:transcriptional regulator with XRE-family HTH domain